MLWILAFMIVITLALVSVGMFLSAPRYRGKKSDHFDGRRFHNPGGAKAKGGRDLLRWLFTRKAGAWPEALPERHGMHPLGHFKEGIRITFVNHSTLLIQVAGVNILTDPVWSRRASPFRRAGPKRKRPPAIRFEDLPRIHLVLLSHNHYDHLDLETMRMVFAAHHPRIITPLGVGKYLEHHYITGSVEGDWWDEIPFNDELKVRLVPAQHFSGRGFLDRDATLWCGYVIHSLWGNIYFSGDTGYNASIFRDIGDKCGPFKVSLLAIGAYKPRWFMSPVHLSPEEAVLSHKMLRTGVTIPIHYGTFPMGDDGFEDPLNDLKASIEKLGAHGDEFAILKEGDYLVIE